MQSGHPIFAIASLYVPETWLPADRRCMSSLQCASTALDVIDIVMFILFDLRASETS